MKKILIIEDNLEIRENTAELLELNNYSVFTAESGHSGFELAKKTNPDIILCDMMMPESDGQEFLRLASSDDIVHQIPLIFFSAGSSASETKKSLIKKSANYLQKPFTEKQLLQTIERGLSKKEKYD